MNIRNIVFFDFSLTPLLLSTIVTLIDANSDEILFYDIDFLSNFFSTAEVQSATKALTAPADLREKHSLIESLKHNAVFNGYTQKDKADRGCLGTDYELSSQHPLDASEKSWKIQVRLYRKKRWKTSAPKDLKTVIIVPPTGGFSIVDKAYANRFCRKYNIQTLILKGWEGDRNGVRSENEIDRLKNLTLEDIVPSFHDRTSVTFMAALKTSIAFLDTDEPLGILGNSVGALSSALAMTLIPQIKTSVLIAGGVNLAGIVAQSDEKRLITLRNVRSSLVYHGQKKPEGEEHFLNKDYLNIMESHVFINPLSFLHKMPNKAKKKNALVVIAKGDRTVREKFQTKLFQKLDQSNRVNASQILVDARGSARGPHTGAIVKAALSLRKNLRSEFAQYFKKNL